MIRPNRGVRALVLGVLGLVLVALLPACSNSDQDDARKAAQAFLADWSRGNFGGAAGRTDGGKAAETWLTGVAGQLGAQKVSFDAGKATVDGDGATQRFTASWVLGGFESQPWTYDSALTLRKSGDDWRVHWDPSLVHPDLDVSRKFVADRKLGARADVLDRTGAPLFTSAPVVEVGLEPRAVTDVAAVTTALAGALGIDAAQLAAEVKKAKPTAFVSVITLRKADYERVKPKIYDLPGTRFRESTKVLAPSTTFARRYLGTVGDATREVLREAGPAYEAGDTLGLSGVQRSFNKQLAGVPDLTVSIGDAAGKPVKQVLSRKGKAGTPLKLTLDRGIQTAADSVLAGVRQPAAIVAVRPSSGEVVAVANSAAAPFDIALEGKYPPGSTFKIVSASAALDAGLVQPAAPVPCPATIDGGGKTFQNANKFVLGTVPFRTAFAKSCNTTFVDLSGKLPADALTKAGAQYGLGAKWQGPVAVFGGSVPAVPEATDRAAASIGQGTVLASPLSMALVAATVSKGSVPAPSFVAGEPAKPSVAAPARSAAQQAALKELTRAVVTEGTATALGSVPGGPVAGKTGTAEYGDATPPRAHSWFVGYRGDLAIAVFVYDGDTAGVKGTALASQFLSRVPA